MKSLGILTSFALLPKLVGLFIFNVHSIHISIALGASSVIILVLGYLILIVGQLFQLFWESLELESDSFDSLSSHQNSSKSLELKHLPLAALKKGYLN